MAKRIPTIYLCLWDANNTGYPLRTSISADLVERVLKGLTEKEEWRFLCFAGCYSMLPRRISEL